MPDGSVKHTRSVDSSSPVMPFELYNPTNVRDVLQRQIRLTVDSEIDKVVDLSVGGFDGRFLGNFPGDTQFLSNAHGQFYHIIGVSKGGDLSVAAP